MPSMSAPAAYSPKMLAERWACSEKHVRSLVHQGKLSAFRVGGKLIRIPAEAVTEYEGQGACQDDQESLGASDESGADSHSSGTTREENGTVTRLQPAT